MRILVADDSKTNLSLITNSLVKLGHEVITANNGKEAIKEFIECQPDLIILDVVMEGMSGLECAKQIRSLNVNLWIPIIFLSGSIDDDSIAKGIDAGGDDYLSKPFSETTLAAKIKAMQRISDMRKKLFEATEQLTILSTTDTLTGINNRFQFNRSIKEQIHQSIEHDQVFALLFIDLDKFKIVNDSLGHQVGDALLIQVTHRLQSCIRSDDFLARMGGDEFAIILNNITDYSITETITKRIISSLATPFNLSNQVIHITTSIGITYYPGDATTEEDLLRNADIAMYQAKQAGRNNYKFYNKNLERTDNANLSDSSILTHIISQDLTPPDLPAFTHQNEAEANVIDVLNCTVINTNICLELKNIQKILPLAKLTILPNCPDYMVGMLNLAGKSIPVVDLGVRLSLTRVEPYSLNTPVILCTFFDRNNMPQSVALIVDKILEIENLDRHELHLSDYIDKPDYPILGSITSRHGLAFLINLQNVFSTENKELVKIKA